MIQKIRIGCVLALIVFSNRCMADFFNLKLFDSANRQSLIVSEYEEKRQRLQALTNELALLQTQNKQQESELKNRQAVLEKEIKTLTEFKKEHNGNGFNVKKIAVLREIQQALSDLAQERAQHLYILGQSVEMLQAHLDNQQGASIGQKTSYQLSDLQKLSKQWLSAQEEFNRTRFEKNRYQNDLEQLNQKIVKLEHDLKGKEQLKARFESDKLSSGRLIELDHQSELLDLQVNLAKLKYENALAKLATMQKSLDLVDSKVAVAKVKRASLKKALAHVERKVWVTDADVHRAEAVLNESKHDHTHAIESANAMIAALTTKRSKIQKAFELLNKRLSTPIKDNLSQFIELVVEPHHTAEITVFNKAALLNQAMQTIDRELALLSAQKQLHVAYIADHELELDALKAWVLLSHRMRVADDAARQALIKQFSARRVELQKDLDDLKRKDSAASALMSAQSRVAQQLQRRIDYVVSHKDTLKKRYGVQAYQTITRTLARLQEHLNHQLDICGQLIKLYAVLTIVFSDMNAELELLNAKLEGAGGIWQRSADALTSQGVYSALADLRIFWEEVVTTILKTSIAETVTWGGLFFADPINVLYLILLIVFMAAFYFFLLLSLPWASGHLDDYEKQHGISFLSRTMGCFLAIGYRHLVGLTIWGALFLVMHFDAIFDIGSRIKLAFYLGSIPYACYMVHVIINSCLLWFSHWRIVLSKTFISVVLHVFGFASVIIQFGHEAFFTTMYGHSEVSMLLYAAQSLITRATIILLLMNREVILAFLPQRSGMWGVVRMIIDRFYGICWLILATLIVLSDPYVGYGRLVSTLLRGGLWSLILLGIFWLAHFALKRYSSHLFFTSVSDGGRERFAHARTWYVAFLICSIVLLLVTTIIFLARAWGYAISFEQISEFFNLELAKIRGEGVGQFTSFTVRSVVMLFGIILGSFLATAFINRFVWHRVFELLEVDSGVQHTISRMTGYLVFIIALIISLYQVGLGSWVPAWIALVIAAIVWSVKDPINDFLAYFILLVERSIKIGDYIRINDPDGELGGVVRKITPRSVVLRKNNSFYLVVPNSKVLNAPFANWNYGHSYVAFEDIRFAVAYQSDPLTVKNIVLEVLAKNSMILKNPTPIVRIEDFGATGFEFMVRGFMSASNFLQQWDVRSDIRFALVQQLAKNNIELAVPFQHVHILKNDENN